MIDFQDRVAVITGAGGGLGRAYALLLASRGASVVVNDLGGSVRGEGADAGAADSVVEEIRSSGGTAVAEYSSVADPEGGAAIIARAEKEFGRLDILISNAALGVLKPVVKLRRKDWNWTMDINARALIPLARRDPRGEDRWGTATAAGVASWWRCRSPADSSSPPSLPPARGAWPRRHRWSSVRPRPTGWSSPSRPGPGGTDSGSIPDTFALPSRSARVAGRK